MEMDDILESTDLAVLRKQRGVRKYNVKRYQAFVTDEQSVDPPMLNTRMAKKFLSNLELHLQQYELIQQRVIELLTDPSEIDKEEKEFTSASQTLTTLVDELTSLVEIGSLDKKASFFVEEVEELTSRYEPTGAHVTKTVEDLASLERQTKAAIADIPLPHRAKLERCRERVLEASRTLFEYTKRLCDSSCSDSRTSVSTTTCSSDPPSRFTRRSLPSLEIPVFTGGPMEWPTFWRRFQQVMDKESDLTDSDKASYLYSAIKCKEGVSVLESSPTVVQDYGAMIKLLQSRFDQKRLVFRNHLQKLISYRSQGQTKNDMQQYLVVLRQGLFALRQSGHCEADYLFTAIAELTMDKKTLSSWTEYSREHQDVPTVDHIESFLEERIRALPDEVHLKVTPSSSNPTPESRKSTGQRSSVHTTQRDDDCGVCHSGRHPLFSCPAFRKLSTSERQSTVQRLRACTNCLSTYHSFKNCKSHGTCRDCGKAHHTLLHRSTTSVPIKSEPTTHSEAHHSQPTVNITHREHGDIVFLTGRGVIQTPARNVNARIFFDSGADATLITSKLANTLRAKPLPGTVSVSGIAGLELPHPCKQTRIELLTGDADERIELTAIIVDKIISDLPHKPLFINREDPIFSHIELSDPAFDRPGKVDLLVGLRVLNRIMKPEAVRRTPDKRMILYPTTLGWLASCDTQASPQAARVHLTTSKSLDETTHGMIRSFWEIEHGPAERTSMSKDDQLAIDQFNSTISRKDDGRYQVKLPFRDNSSTLGRSREQAAQRFISNEKSLRRKGQWNAFSDVVREYHTLGHAEPVPSLDINKPTTGSYYLPMHGVAKSSSTTTKLRVVFDASAKTSTGVSLNDTLLPGPNLYPLLQDILLKFRKHSIGLTADISKMFREVAIDAKDRDFHRFLWRDASGMLQDWRMTRLTFGVTSSPFLATQVLKQIALDYQDQFPEAAAIVLKQFYVDDCLTGANTEQEAISRRKELNTLMSKGCMTLRKWRSSSSTVTNSIPLELREQENTVLPIASPAQCHKALGVHWDITADTLHVATPTLEHHSNITKRQITSELARTFDVMGWFTPAILIAKALVQSLWKLTIGWDENVPPDVEAAWLSWKSQLPMLTTCAIPRYYHQHHKDIQAVQLHGFSDASKVAYAGVIYLRTFYSDTTVSTTLIIAKSRLAPLKTMTIPRLELCGAQLLSQLIESTRTTLQIDLSECHAWCDSMITLAWLNSNSNRLQTFVANRVNTTTNLVPASQWKYIPTKDNPADAASRGMSPEDLLSHTLWWSGPPWLSKPPTEWPARTDFLKQENLPGLKKLTTASINLTTVITTIPQHLTTRISSWNTIRRVMAWILRFVSRLKYKKLANRRTSIPLSVEELEQATFTLIKIEQLHFFGSDIAALQTTNSISAKSSLSALHPFLDNRSILRVGGRIQRSQQPYNARHPMILHKGFHIVRPLIRWFHLSSNHLGASGLLGLLSEVYYIVGARQTIRSITRNCIPCRKAHARTASQLMGQLPPHRVNPSSVFAEVGVDFAGPITLKKGHTRRPVLIKGYVSVFVCMATKAVHLEPVSDLSTSAFLAALHRFTSRRGKPRTIHSDNGTNFVGAERELKEVYDIINQDAQTITNNLSAVGINWAHIPGHAPHFGGLWESTVKSMKYHLRKTVGTHRLNMEELFTILSQIEAALNSRPLVPLDHTPADGSLVLTPGHFLIGRAPLAIHTRQDVQTVSLIKRWNLCQSLVREFWRLWSREYVVTINRFSKWKKPERNLEVGDVVLLKDLELFANDWPLGRISEVHPGKDGLVRAVTVRVNGKDYRRPAVKIVLLLPEDQTTPPDDQTAVVQYQGD